MRTTHLWAIFGIIFFGFVLFMTYSTGYYRGSADGINWARIQTYGK